MRARARKHPFFLQWYFETKQEKKIEEEESGIGRRCAVSALFPLNLINKCCVCVCVSAIVDNEQK